MSFKLNSIITITSALLGSSFKFKGVHEVKIVKSIYSMNETCVIKLPTTARLRKYDTLSTVSVSVAQQWQQGDKVVVQLGYNGNYKTEFVGFVRRLNFTTPVEIECEGYVYQLRNNLKGKTFIKTEYKKIVEYIIAGTDIKMSVDMKKRDLIVDKFTIKTDTAAETLHQLNKHLFNVLAITFHGPELYMGLSYLDVKETVKYKMGWNVIKDNGLKLRDPGNYKVSIKLSGVKGDGTKNVVTSGDQSLNVKKMRSHAVTATGTLQVLGDEKVRQLKYKGYEGKITAFGIPFCEHAWKVELTDPRYAEREGSYLIDSVEIIFGMGGFRRIVGIGVKVS